jgi:hypothetical protein
MRTINGGELTKQIQVTDYKRVLGDDGDGLTARQADLEALTSQFELTLTRLIAIGDTREGNMLRNPCLTSQPILEKVGCIMLHEDLGFKIDPGVQSQILVVGAGVAVRATMFAAAIRVHAIAEIHIRTVVCADDALGVIVEKPCRDATQLCEKIRIILEVGVIRYGMNAGDAVRRIDSRTAAMRSRPVVDLAHNGSFQANPAIRLNDSPW